jgi:hypothetical protein
MQQYPAPSLDRGIHPLRLLVFVASAALCGPVILYLALLILFWLMPGGID